jgi:hypothetical protein
MNWLLNGNGVATVSVAERQNHPAAASDFAKCKKHTTAARVHFIVIL